MNNLSNNKMKRNTWLNTVKPSNANPLVASVGVRKLTIATEPLPSIRTSEHGLPGPVVSLKLVIRILIEF